MSLLKGQCVPSPGDAAGADEKLLGEANTLEECVNMVMTQGVNPTDPPIPNANGATYGGKGGKECYAEIGITHMDANPASKWKSCIFKCKCFGAIQMQ